MKSIGLLLVMSALLGQTYAHACGEEPVNLAIKEINKSEKKSGGHDYLISTSANDKEYCLYYPSEQGFLTSVFVAEKNRGSEKIEGEDATALADALSSMSLALSSSNSTSNKTQVDFLNSLLKSVNAAKPLKFTKTQIESLYRTVLEPAKKSNNNSTFALQGYLVPCSMSIDKVKSSLSSAVKAEKNGSPAWVKDPKKKFEIDENDYSKIYEIRTTPASEIEGNFDMIDLGLMSTFDQATLRGDCVPATIAKSFSVTAKTTAKKSPEPKKAKSAELIEQ